MSGDRKGEQITDTSFDMELIRQVFRNLDQEYVLELDEMMKVRKRGEKRGKSIERDRNVNKKIKGSRK